MATQCLSTLLLVSSVCVAHGVTPSKLWHVEDFGTSSTCAAASKKSDSYHVIDTCWVTTCGPSASTCFVKSVLNAASGGMDKTPYADASCGTRNQYSPRRYAGSTCGPSGDNYNEYQKGKEGVGLTTLYFPSFTGASCADSEKTDAHPYTAANTCTQKSSSTSEKYTCSASELYEETYATTDCSGTATRSNWTVVPDGTCRPITGNGTTYYVKALCPTDEVASAPTIAFSVGVWIVAFTAYVVA